MTKTDRILAAWRPGKTARAIAREVGANPTWTSEVLRAHGISTRARNRSDEIVRAARPDKTVAELAREVGMSVAHVSRVVGEKKLPHRSQCVYDYSEFDGARLDDLVEKYGRSRRRIAESARTHGFKLVDGVLVDCGDEEFEREHKGFAPWDREYGAWCDAMHVEGFDYAPETWKRYREIWARKSR